MQAGEQMSLFDRDGCFGKMSREPCPRMEAMTSEPFLKRPQELSTPESLFLDLRVIISRPPDRLGWSRVGCIMADGWSLAWAVHNSEHWGLPQRRERVSLVADFGGQTAPEVLFERESSSEHIEPSQEKGHGTSQNVRGCFEANNLTQSIFFSPRSQDGTPRIHEKAAPTLNAQTGGQMQPCIAQRDGDGFIVRKITPLEYERLQGFPDNWTKIGEWTDSKGKKHKEADTPRYKALGNSIALPFWEWLAARIVESLRSEGVDHPTMASLFDGIGGFPLVFSRCGCHPVWASEIEEFPMAVTRKHFPEEGEKEG